MLFIFILFTSLGLVSSQATVLLNQACNPQALCADPLSECANGFCRCRAGFTQIGNTCTLPQSRKARLNDFCDRHSDCITPWAWCGNNRRCQCRPNYGRDNVICRPSKFYCAYGWWNDPLKIDGNPVECISYPTQGGQFFSPMDNQNTVQKRQAPQVNVPTVGCPRPRMDNCPVGTYCNLIQPDDSLAPGSLRKGICCYKPGPSCPTGNPYSTNSSEDCSACPLDTHFCFCDQLTNVAACCPRPCPVGFTFVNNQCVPPGGSPVPTVTPCNNDNQCGAGAKCANVNGQPRQCICKNGLSYINGACTASLCASGQPAMNNGLMLTCSATQPCPANYQCDLTRRACCPNLCPPGQVFGNQMCNPQQAPTTCQAGFQCAPTNACCGQQQGK